MARKPKEEVQNVQADVQADVQNNTTEQQDQEVVVELTPEQVAIQAALSADDHIAALTELKGAEGTSERLSTIIATFLALTKALGEDAPATQHALANVQNYKPDAVKARKEKANKVPAFNAVKELHLVLATNSIEALDTFAKDERVPAKLSVLVTTYTTLAKLEGIDQVVIDTAKANLASFGRKGRSGAAINREQFHIEANGVVYTTLTGALDANGLHKGDIVEVDGKQRDVQDLAWRTVRPKLLTDGEFEYKGVTYKKVAPSADAVQTQRTKKVADKATEDQVVESEETDSAE